MRLRFSHILGSAAFVVCATLATSALAGPPAMPPYFSEMRIDQISNDDDEFIEIAGDPGFNLAGYTIVIIGDNSTGGASGVIDDAIDLSGNSINAMGYFVLAESTFTLGTADATIAMNMENSDNVTYLLVLGFSGMIGDDLDTDDDGVLDVEPWTTIIDLVALVEEPNPPTMTEFHYGPPALCTAGPTCQSVGPDGTFVPGHVYRCPDFLGSFVIGAFDPVGTNDTPGAANDCMGMMTDAGVSDGGMMDAMVTDSGTTDAGMTDMGMPGTDMGMPGTDMGMPGTDTGINPGTDMGMSSDAGEPVRRGCNCHVGASDDATGTTAPAAVLLMVLLGAALRRRRS